MGSIFILFPQLIISPLHLKFHFLCREFYVPVSWKPDHDPLKKMLLLPLPYEGGNCGSERLLSCSGVGGVSHSYCIPLRNAHPLFV